MFAGETAGLSFVDLLVLLVLLSSLGRFWTNVADQSYHFFGLLS